MRIGAGDRFVCVGRRGGGYGDPLARDLLRVRDDVADGLISSEAAKAEYGVVLNGTGSVDEPATIELRHQMRMARNISALPQAAST